MHVSKYPCSVCDVRNRSAVGPVAVGAISDALGGIDNPEGLRATLLLFSLLPTLHAIAVYRGRTKVAVEHQEALAVDFQAAGGASMDTTKYWLRELHNDGAGNKVGCTHVNDACAKE
eukprot:SAG31_NODE_8648_length_1414_cov_1.313308_2_plen_117_part_00